MPSAECRSEEEKRLPRCIFLLSFLPAPRVWYLRALRCFDEVSPLAGFPLVCDASSVLFPRHVLGEIPVIFMNYSASKYRTNSLHEPQIAVKGIELLEHGRNKLTEDASWDLHLQ